MADSILALLAVALCAGLLWGNAERRIKELKDENIRLKIERDSLLWKILEEVIDLTSKKKETKKMSKITPPKGGSTSAGAGKNSTTSKPPKGNSNPSIRRSG